MLYPIVKIPSPKRQRSKLSFFYIIENTIW
nr:MAG TPA_asm: hypothetical protein [Bacteriophage sp.]